MSITENYELNITLNGKCGNYRDTGVYKIFALFLEFDNRIESGDQMI